MEIKNAAGYDDILESSFEKLCFQKADLNSFRSSHMVT